MPTFAALGKSGWPRMGYPFSLGQRFICADKLQHTLQKWVWPAGHLLSRRRERRQRGAKGPPLEPRMVLSAFFLGKPPQRGRLNHPLYKKGLRPRGLWWSYIYGFAPWAVALINGHRHRLYRPVSCSSKGKRPDHPGFSRGRTPPCHLCSSFSVRRKRAAAHLISF